VACKIFVVFYSMHGHVYKMAQAVKKGIDSVDGCEGILYQVAETLPEEVLAKMQAVPKPENVPIINASDLPKANGIVFGFPTRFGMMCAQMKALFDATGGLWQSGALVGKPASLFTSTGTQGGGQETTIMTSMTQLVHHGMIFIPPGYTHGQALFDVQEVRGGGPWGAGTYAAADGSRQPSELELAAAEHQGSYFAEKAKKLGA